jgi:hypothetical protein
MVETKAEKDMNNEDVLEKKKAAMEYCSVVSKHTSKPWQYVLIPHNAVGRTLQFQYVLASAGVVSNFSVLLHPEFNLTTK